MAFTFVRPVTIDHTKVGATDSSNFPMLISGTYSYLATTTNNGSVTNASGFDIGFYSDSALTTKLNWETVTYTATSGLVVYWVQVPTVSHTSDTVIYMAYGASSITTDQSNKTGTWDTNFKGVYHFEENAASSTVNDATGNSNATGTAEAATAAINTNTAGFGGQAGQVGKAFKFDNTNQNIALTGSLLTTGSALTISWWENHTSDLSAFPSRFILSTSGGAHYLIFRTGTGASAGYPNLAWGPDPVGTTPGCFHDASAPTVAAGWNHFCITATTPETTTPANTAVYANGVSQTVSQTSGAAFSTVSQNRIGHDGADNAANAILDEVRISSGIARSPDWVTAEYNNQLAPDKGVSGASGFYTIGSATQLNITNLTTLGAG